MRATGTGFRTLRRWAGAMALLVLAAWPAQAQEQTIRLGLLLSRAEGFNTSVRAGALMGEEELNEQAQAAGIRFEIVAARGGHSSEVAAEATGLIDREGVQALLGSVSDAGTVALSELAQERGLVFFNITNDLDSLRGAKCRRNTFHIAPSQTMRVRALGLWAVQAKEWKNWVILEGDGKSEGRMAGIARDYVESRGGKILDTIPVTDTDAHDPGAILARLRAARAQFIFAALTGEKQELAMEAIQGAKLGIPAGGAEPELARMGRDTAKFDGYWTTGWNHRNNIFGASELNNRFAAFAGLPMNERAWSAWAAVKVLGEAVLRAKSARAADLVPYLQEQAQFDGYVGSALSFQPWNHQLRQVLQVVRVNHETPWNGWDSVVPEATVPFRGMKGIQGDPLDAFSPGAEESGCKM